MQLSDVKTIGVMGGGVMGGGIAQVSAIAGFDVVVRDLNDELIEQTRDSIFESRWGMKRAVEIGKLAYDTATEAIPRISFTTEVAGLAEVDFLIEAVPERLELKQEAFKELDTVVKPDAIFTSNTSGFVIAEIARDVSEDRKGRFAGMHFSNPVPTMKMCEVISTPPDLRGDGRNRRAASPSSPVRLFRWCRTPPAPTGSCSTASSPPPSARRT